MGNLVLVLVLVCDGSPENGSKYLICFVLIVLARFDNTVHHLKLLLW